MIYITDATAHKLEIKAIAQWFAEWAHDINAMDNNLIALGDFNIDRQEGELYQAFTSTGLGTPGDLSQVPSTLFSDPARPNLDKFYDPIAWFPQVDGKPSFSLKYHRGGSFEFTHGVLMSRGLTKQGLSWRISDHYPLWVEFLVR